MMKFYDRPIILITDKSKLKFGSTLRNSYFRFHRHRLAWIFLECPFLHPCSRVVLFRTLRCFVCFTFMEEEEGYEGGCLTRPNRQLLYNWNSSLVGRRSASDTGLCKARRRGGVSVERSGTTSRKRERRIVQFG